MRKTGCQRVPQERAGTAQRGEWPTSLASSGGCGARGVPPGRGLALPVPGPDRTRAGPATGDKLEPVNVPPNSPVKSPLTRDRGRVRGRVGGRMSETRPLKGGENQGGAKEQSEGCCPSWRPARRRRFDDMDHPVSLEKLDGLAGDNRRGDAHETGRTDSHRVLGALDDGDHTHRDRSGPCWRTRV